MLRRRPGSHHKYKAGIGYRYGCGLRVSEVVALKVFWAISTPLRRA